MKVFTFDDVIYLLADHPFINGVKMNAGRLTTLEQLHDLHDVQVEALVGQYESYILTEDEFQGSGLMPIPVYDVSVDFNEDGTLGVELHSGNIDLPLNTVIYWK
jgi:hypothetical protein